VRVKKATGKSAKQHWASLKKGISYQTHVYMKAGEI